MDEKRMFLTILGGLYPDELPEILFRTSAKALFPKLNLSKKYPQIQKMVEILEDNTGCQVCLSFGTDSMGEIDFGEVHKEIVIICAVKASTQEEFFWSVVTPIGTFNICFFRWQNGRFEELVDMYITDKIKKELSLAPCEIEITEDSFEVTKVYPRDMPFPPRQPEFYTAGSKQEAFAREFYRGRDEEDKIFIPEDPDFIDEVMENFGCVDMANVDDGAIATRLIGDKYDILEEAERLYRRGEISDYVFREVTAADLAEIGMSEEDLEEFLEEIAFRNKSGEEYDMTYYVIRPDRHKKSPR